MNKNINAYLNIEEIDASPYDFEKLWYERAVMVLVMIRNGNLDQVKSHKVLLELCDNLSWIKFNLNVELSADHRFLLEKIFDSSVKIIQGYIVDKDPEYLNIVIKSLKTVAEPYKEH